MDVRILLWAKSWCYFFSFFFSLFLTLYKNGRWQAIFYPRSHPLKLDFCWNKIEDVYSISLSPCAVRVLAPYIHRCSCEESASHVRTTVSAVGSDLPMGFNSYRYWREAVGGIYMSSPCVICPLYKCKGSSLCCQLLLMCNYKAKLLLISPTSCLLQKWVRSLMQKIRWRNTEKVTETIKSFKKGACNVVVVGGFL